MELISVFKTSKNELQRMATRSMSKRKPLEFRHENKNIKKHNVKLQNETQCMVTRSMSKRKHPGSVNDNENRKKLKKKRNEQGVDNMKVEIEEEVLQTENDIITENKEQNVRPTHLEVHESCIDNLKDDDAFDPNDNNAQKRNLTITTTKLGDVSCEKRHGIAINTDYETVSESRTTSQNSYESSTTGIDALYSRISTFTSSETIRREKPKAFRKLYRLLGELEHKDNGLRAKNPLSSTKVAEHVAYGSTRLVSKYISTCSTLSAAKNLLRLKMKSKSYRNGIQTIVAIDVNNLPSDVAIIDLTNENIRKKYELQNNDYLNEKFHKFAASYGEVLLEGYIPPDCLEYA
ncbi:uncharacterized protein LOC134727179 [Mytilus trossulus]|uniref:uncharacterized protein LOC134727179 n=1 Tax=Mytilus trossulus TaxID=6551 RepID=UPI003007A6F3